MNSAKWVNAFLLKEVIPILIKTNILFLDLNLMKYWYLKKLETLFAKLYKLNKKYKVNKRKESALITLEE